MQLSIDFNQARAEGERLADLCADKAEKVSDFDTEGAGRFIVSQLVRNGDMSGEALTNAAKECGFRPHDDRAFGSVFQRLSKKGQIRTVGYCLRTKGRGTAGGRIWGLVR